MRLLCALMILAVFLAIDPSGVVQCAVPVLLPVDEKMTIVTLDKKTRQKRAEVSFRFREIKDHDKTFYELRQEGRGDYGPFVGCLWTIEAKMELRGKILSPLRTVCVVKDLDQKKIMTWENDYDYDQRKILVTKTNGQGKILTRATLPLKGPTADEATLFYFLKPLLASIEKKDMRRFYLVSVEPKIYPVDIKDAGREMLDLPVGKTMAVKLKLVTDKGIISKTLRGFSPQTVVWYQHKAPFHWLKYEGRKPGLSSTNVLSYVTFLETRWRLRDVLRVENSPEFSAQP